MNFIAVHLCPLLASRMMCVLSYIRLLCSATCPSNYVLSIGLILAFSSKQRTRPRTCPSVPPLFQYEDKFQHTGLHYLFHDVYQLNKSMQRSKFRSTRRWKLHEMSSPSSFKEIGINAIVNAFILVQKVPVDVLPSHASSSSCSSRGRPMHVLYSTTVGDWLWTVVWLQGRQWESHLYKAKKSLDGNKYELVKFASQETRDREKLGRLAANFNH